ncbi:MAG TPA: XRE family transcriptional regulator [Ktedonobacteraceae bacterium]|nr:XRE family transcriptional regulator [Ktedonobacteraceae bacterium]
MQPEGLLEHISKTIRTLRRERGLSLGQLATLTQVSKPMLGQIERGESNPTVLTLWKIARGLQVPFSVLLKDPMEPQVLLIRRSEQPTVIDDAGSYIVRHIVSGTVPAPYDVFHGQLLAGGSHRSEAHGPGVEETLFLIHGKMMLSVGDASYELEEGDALHFVANIEHVYFNPTQELCVFQMLIFYHQPGTQRIGQLALFARRSEDGYE